LICVALDYLINMAEKAPATNATQENDEDLVKNVINSIDDVISRGATTTQQSSSANHQNTIASDEKLIAAMETVSVKEMSDGEVSYHHCFDMNF